MVLDKLHLEITRNCTLACEHCLRGDAQHINMSLDTLENVFRDVNRIQYLLLTGGEPLLAVEQLERLVEILKSGKVVVDHIGLVTNGTVLSERIIRILTELNTLSELIISISGDIFHMLEIKRLGLELKRYDNSDILFSLFNTSEYVREYGPVRYITYEAIGRAKDLTPRRLDEINKIAHNIYRISIPCFSDAPSYTIHDNQLCGTLTIDVHGNVVTGSRSFSDEDEEAKRKAFNVNEMGLREASLEFIQFKEAKNDLDAKTLTKKYW